MRILITTQSRGAAGGVAAYLQSLVPHLIEAGHQVSWLIGNSSTSEDDAEIFNGQSKWIAEPDNCNLVFEAIESWKPDVVYAHGLSNGKWDRWLSSRYPTAFFAHGFYGACISGRKCHTFPSVTICQRKLGPPCLLFYLPRRCGGRSPLRMLKDYRDERQRQDNLHRYRVVLVASQYMSQEYLRQGAAAERIKVLPLFSPEATPDITPPKPWVWKDRVLMVSRLTDLKGAQFAAEAVSIAAKRIRRPLQLVIAGDGPGRVSIEEKARIHDVPTQFLGWLNGEQRNAAMREADALIVPSVWPEPFGLVGIEAGCVGLPSVAFDVGGIPDWLERGVSGELASANPATASGLGEALARALVDREHHAQLRLNAWQTAKRFSVASHLSLLTQILEQMKNSVEQHSL